MHRVTFLALDCSGNFQFEFSTSDFGCITSYTFGVYAFIVTAIHVPAILVLQGERYARPAGTSCP